MNETITVDGIEYDVTDVFERTLLVKGAEPTDFDRFQFINVLADHKNRKLDAGGTAQAVYRYSDLADLPKFHAHLYPYYMKVKMTTVTDKKGEPLQQILWADFANVQELELVPRNAKPTQTKPTQTSTTKS